MKILMNQQVPTANGMINHYHCYHGVQHHEKFSRWPTIIFRYSRILGFKKEK